MQYNYNVGGLQVDIPGIMLKKAQLDNAKQRKLNQQLQYERSKRENAILEDKEKERQRQLRVQEQIAQRRNSGLPVDDLMNTLAGMDPAAARQLNTFEKEMSEDQIRNMYMMAAEAQNLMANNQPELAVQNLRQRNSLLLGAGRDNKDTQSALDVYDKQGAEGLKKILDATVATGVQGGYLDALEVGKDNSDIYGYYAPKYDEDGKEYIPAVNKLTQETKKLYTGANKAPGELELTNVVEKNLTKLADEARTLEKDSSTAMNLASEYKRLAPTSGIVAEAEKFVTDLTGTQDAVSMLRKNTTRLINSRIINNLPPGIASDRDVAIIQAGFPKDTTNANTMSQYLESMGKVLQAESVYNNLKAEFSESTFGVTKARQNGIVGGLEVKKGETFNDFLKRYNETERERIQPQNDARTDVDILNQYGIQL